MKDKSSGGEGDEKRRGRLRADFLDRRAPATVAASPLQPTQSCSADAGCGGETAGRGAEKGRGTRLMERGRAEVRGEERKSRWRSPTDTHTHTRADRRQLGVTHRSDMSSGDSHSLRVKSNTETHKRGSEGRGRGGWPDEGARTVGEWGGGDGHQVGATRVCTQRRAEPGTKRGGDGERWCTEERRWGGSRRCGFADTPTCTRHARASHVCAGMCASTPPPSPHTPISAR